MVTAFVDKLPKYCPYCGGRCWRVYKYANRCSDCCSYFHRKFKTCREIEDYDIYLCRGELQLIELADGTLLEVCQGCVDWLEDEGLL